MDDPRERDALVSEDGLTMFGLSNKKTECDSESPSTALGASNRPGALWRNFHLCPHCLENGRQGVFERLNVTLPIISRSDGVSYHLVMGDKPISYPAENSAGQSDMKSVGFWYLHEANPCTETVVVILRRPPQNELSLLRHIETVADRLAEKLQKKSKLPCLYEFDGHRLHTAW